MEQVLLLRENAVKYFRRFDIFLFPAIKFFAGFFIFSLIANFGLLMPMFEFLDGPPIGTMYLMAMGAVTAFMSPMIIYLAIAFSLAIFLSAVLEVAFAAMIFVILIMFFYVRLSPRESLLILATFFAFYFRIPYVIPIICGLYFGLTSIIPVTIGAFAWNFSPVIAGLIPAHVEAVTVANLDIMELPGTFLEMFASLGEALAANTSWVLTSFVFALVIVVVHFMSRQEINYSSEISIGLGIVICIISFAIVGTVISDSEAVLSVFLMSIPTAIICFVIKFFDVALDYKKSDRVTFEDDDNVYHVKIVPKIQILEPEPAANARSGRKGEQHVSATKPERMVEPPQKPMLNPERNPRQERPERQGTPPRVMGNRHSSELRHPTDPSQMQSRGRKEL